MRLSEKPERDVSRIIVRGWCSFSRLSKALDAMYYRYYMLFRWSNRLENGAVKSRIKEVTEFELLLLLLLLC